MTPAPLDPIRTLEQENIQIYSERLRQVRLSFNLAIVIISVSGFVGVVGAVQLLRGYYEGSFTACVGVGASTLCSYLAKVANDRLDKLAQELDERIKTKATASAATSNFTQNSPSTGKSLLEHLKTIGTWEGNDFDECLKSVIDNRLPAEFKNEPNPFD
jgi:hypothetical protein